MVVNRREFLGLGLGLGSLLVTSCSGAGGRSAPGGTTPVSPLPNAFRFNVVEIGALDLRGRGPLVKLPGMCFAAEGEVFFMARDGLGAMGVYAGEILPSPAGFGLGPLRKVLRQGDALPGGAVVGSFTPGRVSSTGDFATVVHDRDGVPMVVAVPNGGAPTVLLSFAERFQGNLEEANFSRFKRVSLDRNGDMLLVASHSRGTEGRSREGFFFLPQGENSASARILLSTGDLAPGSPALLHRLGIHDAEDGYYALQADLAAFPGSPPESCVIVGSVGTEATLGVAPPELQAGPPAAWPGRAPLAPRVDGSGRTGLVVAETPTLHRLVLGNQVVASTGDPSPSGRVQDRFIPPMLAPEGLAWYLASSKATALQPTDAAEFLVTNGVDVGLVLTVGQALDGRRLDGLFAGAYPGQANPDGLLAMTAVVDGKPALLLGGPL